MTDTTTAATTTNGNGAGSNIEKLRDIENAPEVVHLEDFYAYMPMSGQYIFTPSGEMWPAASVNARLKAPDGKTKASIWISQNRPVEQMTWAPGLPPLIRDRLISEGGWINHDGMQCFNQYRPPTIPLGDADKVGPWLEHIERVYGDNIDHIVKWLAQRVQNPGCKLNHALVFGGAQGIGKDTILEPAKRAIGPWNFSEASPHHLLGRFNGYLRSVILRVSEARDLGDVDRFQFYDHLKGYIASPPDVLRVDEKNLREYSIPNLVGVIITTNHKADGIYLPADDRRHYVAWSDCKKEDFDQNYWNAIWQWYDNGGASNVAAYLTKLDLSGFDPKAPPPKTAAFWEIVDSSRAPEDAEMADAIDECGSPLALTLSMISARVGSGGFADWLHDRKNARKIPHRLESCGYVPVRNTDAKDGHWKVNDRRQVIYAKAEIPLAHRIAAARRLSGG
jgi:hypothetical protein